MTPGSCLLPVVDLKQSFSIVQLPPASAGNCLFLGRTPGQTHSCCLTLCAVCRTPSSGGGGCRGAMRCGSQALITPASQRRPWWRSSSSANGGCRATISVCADKVEGMLAMCCSMKELGGRLLSPFTVAHVLSRLLTVLCTEPAAADMCRAGEVHAGGVQVGGPVREHHLLAAAPNRLLPGLVTTGAAAAFAHYVRCPAVRHTCLRPC